MFSAFMSPLDDVQKLLYYRAIRMTMYAGKIKHAALPQKYRRFLCRLAMQRLSPSK